MVTRQGIDIKNNVIDRTKAQPLPIIVKLFDKNGKIISRKTSAKTLAEFVPPAAVQYIGKTYKFMHFEFAYTSDHFEARYDEVPKKTKKAQYPKT